MRRSLRWLVAVLLLSPLALIGTCMARGRWWWAGAESAIATAVQATAEGRTAQDVAVTLESTTSTGAKWDPKVDFHTSYRTTGADNFLRGTNLLDMLDPAASAYVAHLAFANGHIYHVEAVREDGRWFVSLEPAEGQ